MKTFQERLMYQLKRHKLNKHFFHFLLSLQTCFFFTAWFSPAWLHVMECLLQCCNKSSSARGLKPGKLFDQNLYTINILLLIGSSLKKLIKEWFLNSLFYAVLVHYLHWQNLFCFFPFFVFVCFLKNISLFWIFEWKCNHKFSLCRQNEIYLGLRKKQYLWVILLM